MGWPWSNVLFETHKGLLTKLGQMSVGQKGGHPDQVQSLRHVKNLDSDGTVVLNICTVQLYCVSVQYDLDVRLCSSVKCTHWYRTIVQLCQICTQCPAPPHNALN